MVNFQARPNSTIKPNLNPNEPIEPPVGRTGRQMVSRQAYSMSAVDEYGKVIDDIYFRLLKKYLQNIFPKNSFINSIGMRCIQ